MLCRLLVAAVALSTLSACAGPAASGPSPAPSVTAPAAESATPSPSPALWRTAAAPKGAPAGSQWIAVDTFDGSRLVGMVQSPAGTAPAAVLVVLHSDGGLRPKHLEWAASFTRSGFITLTPCWQGGVDASDPDVLGCSVDAPQRSAAADVAKDVAALVAAARTLPRAIAAAVAVVGHSGGAGAAIMAGSLGVDVSAVVAMSAPYGQGAIKTRWGTSLSEQVDGLRPPLLMLQGTNDQQGPGTRIDTAKAYEKLARDKGKTVEAIYPDGAPHDFPFQPQFWTDDLRAKVVAFLRKYLPG